MMLDLTLCFMIDAKGVTVREATGDLHVGKTSLYRELINSLLEEISRHVKVTYKHAAIFNTLTS